MADRTPGPQGPIFSTSALAGMPETGYLRELPFFAKLNLRGQPGNAAFSSAIEALSLTLPQEPNTFDSREQSRLFWLGPDEWLLHANEDPVKLVEELTKTLQGVHSAVVDVSDYYSVIELDTPHALEILARSCPLDLATALANDNCCVQTKVGNAACLVYTETLVNPQSNSLFLQCRWSFAEYLWNLLVANACSFDLENNEFAVRGDDTVVL